MSISQRPSTSTLLRIARKISPSDQRLNRPAGVRLEDTNEPTGIGKCSPMSRPPVSVPLLEWHALQKPSTTALPRAMRTGVASTLRSGTGALRACCLTSPAVMSAPADDTATASTAASTMPLHFRNLFGTPRARKPAQISNAATTINAITPTMSCMLPPPGGFGFVEIRTASEIPARNYEAISARGSLVTIVTPVRGDGVSRAGRPAALPSPGLEQARRRRRRRVRRRRIAMSREMRARA